MSTTDELAMAHARVMALFDAEDAKQSSEDRAKSIRQLEALPQTPQRDYLIQWIKEDEVKYGS